ncbi:MAG: exosortase-associated EpsI family protein [Acidobacteria bacterium]|nr:exosortase-associated EpsI family protein [Acidobacteriota bacterium]
MRLIFMVIILSAAAAGASYLMHSSGNEQVPQRDDLSKFPETTGNWTMTEDRQLTAGEMRELKADDYLSRTYRSSEGVDRLPVHSLLLKSEASPNSAFAAELPARFRLDNG